LRYIFLLKSFFLLTLLSLTQLAFAQPSEFILNGTPTSDGFGWVTAISGKQALVAAPFADAQMPNTGAVFVYREASPNNWIADGQLLASDLGTNDQFGHSIAIDGNIAVVGAPFQNTQQGAVYIFSLDAYSGTWNQVQKLTTPNTAGWPQFGKSVAIDGDTILVSGWLAESTSSSIGEVYLYEKDKLLGQWILKQTLIPSNPSAAQRFGPSVSIRGNIVVVGSYANLVDGYSKAGAAHVYERNITTGIWAETAKLIASDRYTDSFFGISVDTNGQSIVVGANKSSAVAPQAGSVYIFEKDQQGGWQQRTQIIASDAQANDHFGRWVSIAGNSIYVGASKASYNGISQAGAVYRYDYKPNLGKWTESLKVMPPSATKQEHIGARFDADGKRLIIGAGFGFGSPSVSGKSYIYTFKGFDRLSFTEQKNLGMLSNVKQTHATIASLPSSGVSMSAWAGNKGIWYRLFDKDGLPLFKERKVAGTTSGCSYPDISASKQNGFIITWQGETARGYEPFVLILDTKGNPKLTPFPITQNVNFAYSPVKNKLSKIHPDSTLLPSGQFLVVWDTNESGIRHVYIQHFSKDAVAITPIIQLDSNQGLQIQSIYGMGLPDIDSNQNGDVFVAWGGEFNSFNRAGIVYRSFNVSDVNWLANSQSWLTQSTKSNNIDAIRVMVSISELGNIATAWEEKNSVNAHQSNIKIFNASTSTWSNPTLLNYITPTGIKAVINNNPIPFFVNQNTVFVGWSTKLPNQKYIIAGQFFGLQANNKGHPFSLFKETPFRSTRLAMPKTRSCDTNSCRIHMVHEQIDDLSTSQLQFHSLMYISH